MIDKELLTKTVKDAIEGTGIFLVDITVSPANDIVVEIDSVDGIDIDQCVDLTHKIEAVFDREVEDYSLEVGSAGITSPFKVKEQYIKNLGNEVEVLTCDGRKLRGTLVEAGDESFTVEVPVKVKAEGAKRPTIEMQPQTFAYTGCKSVKYHF